MKPAARLEGCRSGQPIKTISTVKCCMAAIKHASAGSCCPARCRAWPTHCMPCAPPSPHRWTRPRAAHSPHNLAVVNLLLDVAGVLVLHSAANCASREGGQPGTGGSAAVQGGLSSQRSIELAITQWRCARQTAGAQDLLDREQPHSRLQPSPDKPRAGHTGHAAQRSAAQRSPDTQVPSISLTVPAKAAAQLRSRITRATSYTSSSVRLPLCLMFFSCRGTQTGQRGRAVSSEATNIGRESSGGGHSAVSWGSVQGTAG